MDAVKLFKLIFLLIRFKIVTDYQLPFHLSIFFVIGFGPIVGNEWITKISEFKNDCFKKNWVQNILKIGLKFMSELTSK